MLGWTQLIARSGLCHHQGHYLCVGDGEPTVHDAIDAESYTALSSEHQCSKRASAAFDVQGRECNCEPHSFDIARQRCLPRVSHCVDPGWQGHLEHSSGLSWHSEFSIVAANGDRTVRRPKPESRSALKASMTQARKLVANRYQPFPVQRRYRDPFTLGDLFENLTPGVEDQGVAKSLAISGMGAPLPARDNEALVLDRTGPAQEVPVCLPGRE